MSHPGFHLGELLRQHGLTQRQFAVLLNKKTSEINEIIKGKRSITIQRDYLLSQAFQFPQKYRLNLQNDYDYQQFLASNSTSSHSNIIPVPKISSEISSDITPPLQLPSQENTPDLEVQAPSTSSSQIPVTIAPNNTITDTPIAAFGQSLDMPSSSPDSSISTEPTISPEEAQALRESIKHQKRIFRDF